MIGVREKKARYPCMIISKLWSYQTKKSIHLKAQTVKVSTLNVQMVTK